MFPENNILIVDDERRMCESLACLLEAKNYTVKTAKTGRQALTLLAKNQFGLAVLDVHLPDMKGTEIMQELKVHRPETVVILITGDANLDSALAALKCGAYDYLKKPFEVEELLNIIKVAIDQKKIALEKDWLIRKLRESLESGKILHGILTICSKCKNIRGDNGRWHQIESYITKHSKAVFSHSICPDCTKKL